MVSVLTAGGVRKESDLSEIGGPTKVIYFEHSGARLGRRRLEFRGLDLWD